MLALAVMLAAFALGARRIFSGWFGGGDVKLDRGRVRARQLSGLHAGSSFRVSSAGAVLAVVQAAAQGRLVTSFATLRRLALTGAAPPAPTLLPYGVAIAGGSTAYASRRCFP